MNRQELTETVLKALRPVAEQDEEMEMDIEDEVSVSPSPTMSGYEEIQDMVMQAMELAKSLGDEKLVTQLGNTNVYISRAQTKGAEAAAAVAEDSKYGDLAEKVIARLKEARK